MRTQANLDALTDALLTNCGDFFGACKTCLLSPSFVNKWMKDDKEVQAAIEAAKEVGAMQLESEAIRRAKDGVEEPVFYQGDVCGYVTKYSDPLLKMLLQKRLKHVYGDDAAQTNVNVNLQQAIQVMPRAGSYEEWLKFTVAAKSIPIEGEVIDITPVMLPAPEHDPAMADIL
jgi:hypothetical protein